jgi:EAL domain-containing protein (putative c-di-GMP-specific phosphodiesterase class I)
MLTDALARLELERDLAGGVDRGEFVVHYQPVVRLHNDTVAGFEALVRWQHPTRGVLLPGAFIPVAEESGKIIEIGDFVLRTACRVVPAAATNCCATPTPPCIRPSGRGATASSCSSPA